MTFDDQGMLFYSDQISTVTEKYPSLPPPQEHEGEGEEDGGEQGHDKVEEEGDREHAVEYSVEVHCWCRHQKCPEEATFSKCYQKI